jgi:hypothetical protein
MLGTSPLNFSNHWKTFTAAMLAVPPANLLKNLTNEDGTF